jgi:hypothetical protein
MLRNGARRTCSGRPNVVNSQLVWAATTFLLILACFGLVEPIVGLPLHVPRNYNEGWNAYWAATAMSGGALYPPLNALTSNNYPPLSFFVVGLLGRLIGDPILAGRALALLGFLLVAMNIVTWLRRCGVRTSLAIASSAAFVITVDAMLHTYIGMDDPQWFGHGLMTTALVILWPNPRSNGRLIIAAVLIVLGGLFKHLLIPVPFALAAWFLIFERRVFWTWISILGVLGSMAFSIIYTLYGHRFVDDFLHSPRQVSFVAAVRLGKQALPDLLPLLCLATASLPRFAKQRPVAFAWIYLGVAIVIGVLAATGAGVSENALFDVVIAASLAAGLALEHLATAWTASPPMPVHLKALVLLPAIAVIAWAPFSLRLNIERLHHLAALAEATPADISLLRQHAARSAACESLALCFWSGAPFNVDLFNFGQKLKTGQMPLDACRQLFDGRRFTIIQLYWEPAHYQWPLIPPECDRTIADNYQVIRKSVNGFFLVARRATAS